MLMGSLHIIFYDVKLHHISNNSMVDKIDLMLRMPIIGIFDVL